MNLINSSMLVGQPLRLRLKAPDDHVVLVGQLAVGRIMWKPVAGGGEVWLWTVTGPYLPPALQPSAGDAGSLEEAKAAFRAKFGAWLHWAATQGGEVQWHGGSHRTAP